MRLIKVPNIIKKIYKNIVWDIPNGNNEIFLTFDDCQCWQLTHYVLKILEEYKIKATFFCTGKYVQENQIHKKIKENGHKIGNHGYSHLNGLKTPTKKYIDDIRKCNPLTSNKFFRPPYGKMSKKQYKILSTHYKIIMWDILTYDFDNKISAQQCFENVIKNVKSGSIIVFHTNYKSEKNLIPTLPRTIKYLLEKQFKFSTIY